jgi:RNA polymerase sigma-70 factor (ECF subfamily)
VLEIINDGYMKIFNKIKGYTYPSDGSHLDAAFKAWMKKIMVYTAIDYIRRKSNRLFCRTASEDLDSIDAGIVFYTDNLGYNELVELVRLLPQSYRWVFNLYVIDGYSHKEIADPLKISESTSRSNLVKAKEHLRRMLKKTYEEILIKYN